MCRRGVPARTGTPRRMLPVGPALYYAFPDEFFSNREVYRTNLDRTVPRHRNPSRKPDRGIQVLRLDQVVSSELFARLRERTVGDKRLCVAQPDRRRRRGRLQRVAVQVLTGSSDSPGKLLVLVKNLLKRVARFFLRGNIQKQHVLHWRSSSPEQVGPVVHHRKCLARLVDMDSPDPDAEPTSPRPVALRYERMAGTSSPIRWPPPPRRNRSCSSPPPPPWFP